MKSKTDHILHYLQKIKAASKEHTKKEIFKDLLHRLYGGVKEIETIIDAISLGAETTILNIPRKNKKHRGSADTLYNNIIIEFENDLKTTYKHAKEQLAGYLLGQFKSGVGYNYTLIASDFINWKVVTPDVSQITNLNELQEHELILNEVATASFTLTEKNAEDFYYWIDRFLFKEEKQKATLKAIEEAFGYQSPVFIEAFNEISKVFNEAKKFGEVQVSYEQWRKFLSIAYGSFSDTENAFVIHTYLSILAKVLAYEVVSNDDFIDDDEMKTILNGEIFHRYNIRNFVDNDFFHWVHSAKYFHPLKKAFRLVAQEIAHFDFTNPDEDVLKGVYQELIDLDTRHALGEYYTPDWLCERITQEFEFKPTHKILDPSCGSGSFLRAAIHRLKQLNPSIKAEEINNCIYGIDIHPLSVQIAKTTLLVSLGKDIINAKKPVHLNIILANTLLAPEGVKTLWGSEFKMQIDKDDYYLNTQVFEDVKLFDEALNICEALAEQTQGKKDESEKAFTNILQKQYKDGGINTQVAQSFYKIYGGLKKVKEAGRDSIWKFIVQNLYKPYFLNNRFDYIIGNPPWFTYSSVKNEEYQNILNKLAENYNIKPKAAGTLPHLEIAAIFLAYCTNYFLKDTGKLAFVLPRSFFVGKQHENTRTAQVKGLKITDIWDLQDVSPLFRIPSCTLFAEKGKLKKEIPKDGLIGRKISGKLPTHNCNLELANKTIVDEDVKWFVRKQGNSTAFANEINNKKIKINPYKSLFKQGAIIVPRTFYFVELTQEAPPDYIDRVVNVRTDEFIQTDAKKPWKELTFKGRIESQFLFRTALSKNILPYSLINPFLITLPISIDSNKKINLYNIDDLRKEGFLLASQWFTDVDKAWQNNRTEINRKYSATEYLNYQNKLITQGLNFRYLVLYNSSAKDANATVVDRKEFDLEFLVDHTAYIFYTDDENEAYYLAAILNSSIPNAMMKDFQAKGLFGARHVHKKILDIYYPKYSSSVATHKKLAALSKSCHEKTQSYLQQNPPQQQLTAIHLGRLRVAIKKHLAKELEEIDGLVGKIL